MKPIYILSFVTLLISGYANAQNVAKPNAFVISKQAPATIVLPATSIPAEETAAQELKQYLGQITGSACQIVREDKVADVKNTSFIYVGATRFANQYVKNENAFADEEWLMQTQNESLILTGGRPRGTLYATYHFLEDVCNVHWWTPYEESVPALGVLPVPAMSKRGKPAFNYRDIYSLYAYDRDGTLDDGRFAARSRIDGQGYAPIDIRYGGSRAYGPPAAQHTFFEYLPPEKYYKDHPDWYIFRPGTPIDTGKFPHINAQLNLSNPEMRQEFLKVLRENIRTSRQAAIDKNLLPPSLYDVSQNDGGSVTWVGEGDKELVAKEGSDAASIVSFVNFMADGIRDEFPDVYLTTLAYHSGEKAPKTLRARDNVIIRLTDTQSNLLLPITAERNRVLRENVEAWAKVAKNLRIWDYDLTYILPSLPTPTIETYAPDLNFFLNHNVEGMFIEFEKPVLVDMRDMKLWVLCKLLEDPTQDTDALVRQFTDGFYGAAGSDVRQYLNLLSQSVQQTNLKKGMPEINWFSGLSQFSYLTTDFLQKANHIFDQAALSVAKDPILSQRVRNARAPVDYAILMFYPQLVKQQVAVGNPAIRTLVGQRLLKTRSEQINLWFPEKAQEVERKKAVEMVHQLTSGPADAPLPEQFKGVPPENIFTYDFRSADPSHGAGVFEDEDAPNKFVTRLDIPDDQANKYKLPMPWGVYGNYDKKIFLTNTIKPEDVPEAGYHWYKLGAVAPSSSSYVFFSWSWRIQMYISDVANSHNPDQKYEVWANLKFDGPLFPHGNAADKNAILLDRVVLVKQ